MENFRRRKYGTDDDLRCSKIPVGKKPDVDDFLRWTKKKTDTLESETYSSYIE